MKTYKSILRVAIIIAIVAFIFVLPVTVFAQDTLEENVEVISEKAEGFGDRMDQWGEKMETWGENLEQALEDGDISSPPPLPFGKHAYEDYSTSPRLGAFINDMDFEDAYTMHYPYCYGVYIDDVTTGGNADRAGLVEGDIIMEFDGEKVRFEDHLLQLRDSKNIGDTVTITIFRNEQEIETQLTFAAPKPKIEKEVKHYPGMKKERKLHPGYLKQII